MRKESKCRKKNNKQRDCTKCKYYGGFVSKNYFKCKVYQSDEYPRDIDIYDRECLKKGTCNNFVPEGVDLDDNLHVNNAMERTEQKDLILIPYKE